MIWGFEDIPSKLRDSPLRGASLDVFCQTLYDMLATAPSGTICLPSKPQLKHLIRVTIDGYEED
jgi:hypothetical protein